MDRHELSFHFNGSLQVAFMAQHKFYQSHTFHMRGVGGKVPIQLSKVKICTHLAQPFSFFPLSLLVGLPRKNRCRSIVWSIERMRRVGHLCGRSAVCTKQRLLFERLMTSRELKSRRNEHAAFSERVGPHASREINLRANIFE